MKSFIRVLNIEQQSCKEARREGLDKLHTAERRELEIHRNDGMGFSRLEKYRCLGMRPSTTGLCEEEQITSRDSGNEYGGGFCSAEGKQMPHTVIESWFERRLNIKTCATAERLSHSTASAVFELRPRVEAKGIFVRRTSWREDRASDAYLETNLGVTMYSKVMEHDVRILKTESPAHNVRTLLF
jgi:hypothetical protein